MLGSVPVLAFELHRVDPKNMTAIVQTHLIATLFILSRPGQMVEDLAEQIAHQNPRLLLSVRVPELYCGKAKGLSKTQFQALFSTGRLLL